MSTAREVTMRRQFVLTVYGADEGGYEDALNEATRLINEGCLRAINSNPSGGFNFDSVRTADAQERANHAPLAASAQ